MIRLLNYTLLSKLGQGSYGQVFVAVHKPTGEVVAIKRFVGVRWHPAMMNSFVIETRVYSRHFHPYIMRCERESARRAARDGARRI